MSEAEVGTAPIPAPGDGAECVGGAAPGPQSRETPGLVARRSVDNTAASAGGGGLDGLLGGETMALYYADVHRTRRNGEGFRITFTTDGVSFKQVDSFADVPAREGDRVFVDTIPLQHTEGVIELLRRDVEVYYLRRLTLIARRREELRLPKTARGDIKALMAIDGKWFRRVTEDFLVMRRMVVTYRSLMRTHQQFMNKYSAVSEEERRVLRPVVKALEEQMCELAERIAEEAGRRYPAYNRLIEELGVKSLAGQEAIAEIIVYIDPSKGFRRIANLVGLFKPVRGKKKIYSGHLRKALQRLTASVNGIRPARLTARLEKLILFKVWMILRQEARGRLAVPAQG